MLHSVTRVKITLCESACYRRFFRNGRIYRPRRIQQKEESMASLSRQLAQWVERLRYEDLPAEVIDRAKGVTLQAVASVLLGSRKPPGQRAVTMITEEEAGVP